MSTYAATVTAYARRSARVLLLDSADRILLLRCLADSADPSSGRMWYTPGGGVEAGEDLVTAAARELREEIGLTVAAGDLHPVAFTGGHAEFRWASGVFRDDFFFCRVDSHEVDTAGLTDLERGTFLGHRWWTVPELAGTDEVVYPYGLVPLLTDLLAGRHPTTPVELPWHHD